MTLQLHRPDGQGGLEPQTETPKDWRDQLRVAALERVARSEPGDEPDADARSRALLAGPRRADFVLLLVGYGGSGRSLATPALARVPRPASGTAASLVAATLAASRPRTGGLGRALDAAGGRPRRPPCSGRTLEPA